MSEANVIKVDQTGAKAEEIERGHTLVPAVDVLESKKELLLVADLPGVHSDSVEVNFEKEQLTIRGRRILGSAEGEQETVFYRRSFAMPRGVDSTKVAARLDNGVLRVNLPKHDAIRPRRVTIQTS